jgi:hypothetical protein
MVSCEPVPRYGAYVLRIWEVRSHAADAEPIWRFSLEPVHSRERRGFPDLESLVAYLRTLTVPTPVEEDAGRECLAERFQSQTEYGRDQSAW